MDREEWLEKRRQGIGGSDISAVLGINPYCTPYQLWLEKMGRSEPKEETPAMKFGRMAEQLVVDYWEKETGHTAFPMIGDSIFDDNHLTHPRHPFLMGSPDRSYAHKNGQGILECKTTNFSISPDDHKFLPFYCQLQWYIGIAHDNLRHISVTEGEIAILNCITKEFSRYMFKRDDEFFNSMKDKAIQFWESHVLKDIPPEPTSSDDIKSLYRQHIAGKQIVACKESYALYQSLNKYNEEIKRLNSSANKIKDEIKTIMKDAESMTDADGNTIITWRTSKNFAKFDEKSFKEANPDLYRKFLITSCGSRRFLIKGEE